MTTRATSTALTHWSRASAPSSPEFLGLYPSRNDTEARHGDLKQRIKYMPRDVAGQHLKVLAASAAKNALSWQYHLQAHSEPNVFSNTAQRPDECAKHLSHPALGACKHCDPSDSPRSMAAQSALPTTR